MEISDSIKQAFERNLGKELAEKTLSALSTPPSVSIRLNPSKLCEVPQGAVNVEWSPYGYILQERPSFTMDPLFHAGCYYVQDSSAMFVGHLFRKALEEMPSTHLRVLDLCAAPGGKTTDLAASLRERYEDDFFLVSNEVMRNRAAILSDNTAIWGDPRIAVTSQDPKAFSQLEGMFDIIVADVPCSGEGMFRKDERAVEEWSEEAVQMCAQRQRRIISDVWPSLREGGILIYSTCTFERCENDDNLQWICETLGAESIYKDDAADIPQGIIKTEHGFLLLPGSVPGEGQWAGAVRKCSSGRCGSASDEAIASRLRALRFGIPKPEIKGRDMVPQADMALCIKDGGRDYPRCELSLSEALHFLHRDTIVTPDAPKGYLTVCYKGHPLGFVKNLGTRCNNLHPMSRRILKSIL